MTPPITEFSGEYRWLSNFWMAPIEIQGWRFPSSEHAYQAAKSLDQNDWLAISLLTSGQAKRFGRTIKIRADWEEIKVDAMRSILTAKFLQNPDLRARLIATGDAELIEGNHWGDTFWGVCKGQGKNILGKLLMELRQSLSQG